MNHLVFTPAIVSLGWKLWMSVACQEVKVDGLDGFLPLLNNSRGVVTVANHISVLDDPLMWACLPAWTFFNARTVRYTLGASDIVFTNRLSSLLMRWGQVIETHRGGGIYQQALELAIKKVADGGWVHIFPEGKVNQRTGNLLRFRWGVARILLEAEPLPEVVPMWLQGFDDVMPEDRGWPRPMPRPGCSVGIVIGAPITDKVEEIRSRYRQQRRANEKDNASGATSFISPAKEGSMLPPAYDGEDELLRAARTEIAALLQHEVQRLGIEVATGKGDGRTGGRASGFGGAGIIE